MSMPPWNAESVSAADALIDRVAMRLNGEFVFPRLRAVSDVSAQMLGPRTIFGAPLPPSFRWVRDGGDHRLKLKSTLNQFGWLLSAKLVLYEPLARHPERMRVVVDVVTNPTRTMALNADLSGDPRLFNRVPAGVALRSSRDAHDNFMGTDALLHPGAPFRWIDHSAVILDGVVDLFRWGLFSHHPAARMDRSGVGDFNSVMLSQIECYWDFASVAPAEHVRALIPAMIAATDVEVARYGVVNGIESIGAVLPNATGVFYARPPDRVRGEIRYPSSISRAVRGSANGPMAHRLATIANDAEIRLNRLLRATQSVRSAHRGYGSLADLMTYVRLVILDQRRADQLADKLLRLGFVLAGDGDHHDLTVAQAKRLVTRGVLMRRAVEARSRIGRRYILASWYSQAGSGHER